MVKIKLTVLFKKKSMLLIMIFLIGCFVCACGKEDSIAGESLVEDTEKVSFTEETKSAEDGSFQYLGNEILNDGIKQIPDYQYRMKE